MAMEYLSQQQREVLEWQFADRWIAPLDIHRLPSVFFFWRVERHARWLRTCHSIWPPAARSPQPAAGFIR
jgi:hypothetical protein